MYFILLNSEVSRWVTTGGKIGVFRRHVPYVYQESTSSPVYYSMSSTGPPEQGHRKVHMMTGPVEKERLGERLWSLNWIY